MTTPIVSVNLSGQKELLSALKELPDRMQKNVIRFALREAAKPILNGAKIRAPKKTGNLVKNLKIKAWKSKKNSGKIGVSVGYVVGGQAFYAHFQEFGWRFGKRPARRQLSPKKLESDIAALREELNLTSVLGGKLHFL
jgi:HK97 gp10 family phage protein